MALLRFRVTTLREALLHLYLSGTLHVTGAERTVTAAV
jgi:hypothetical protein